MFPEAPGLNLPFMFSWGLYISLIPCYIVCGFRLCWGEIQRRSCSKVWSLILRWGLSGVCRSVVFMWFLCSGRVKFQSALIPASPPPPSTAWPLVILFPSQPCNIYYLINLGSCPVPLHSSPHPGREPSQRTSGAPSSQSSFLSNVSPLQV